MKEYIEKLYLEYLEFEAIVKKKNELITNKETNMRDIVKDKTPEQLEHILVHLYVDTILYNKDLQLIFAKLIHAYELYKMFNDDNFSEGLEAFYKTMHQWMPKRVFAIEKEEIVEAETGTLDVERKKFLEGDFFKQILNQTKQN